MRWLYKFPLRLRSLFKSGRVEKDLNDELRFHLEKLIEENARARDEAGGSPIRCLARVGRG